MLNKNCNKCHALKRLSDYAKDSSKKDGYHTVCKECKKLYDKRYRKDHVEIIQEKQAEHYALNRDKIRNQVKTNYKKNKYYYKIMNRVRRHKGIADNTITFDSLETLLMKQDNKCYYCKDVLLFDVKYQVHLDHYKPIISGGLHTINNVVWACEKCNTTKNKRIINGDRQE